MASTENERILKVGWREVYSWRWTSRPCCARVARNFAGQVCKPSFDLGRLVGDGGGRAAVSVLEGSPRACSSLGRDASY